MKFYAVCLVAALVGTAAAWGQVGDAPRGRPTAEDAGEVLTRGPVHEAFAGTISFDPEPGVVAAKAPPDAIEELPPDQKPEGANVDWVPGYWGWDDERSDYLWISGIWRALPPGRQWMPGYWGESTRGFQWTSGYWADAQASEVEYLPEPPQTVEEGPNIAAPSADHIWAPGCWVWRQNRYAWRPGFWATAQPNWVWTPDHYVWAPRGYVFVDGYYDYSVARRGVLFAPVYFSASTYSRRGFSYSPVTVINPAVFSCHLFLRPSYGHYYFGDYYASSYSAGGFSPWFSFTTSRSGYDPFYAHQRWHHRNDRQWDRRVEEDYAHRREHEEARPPRTWTAQKERRKPAATDTDESFVVAASLGELADSKDAPVRFKPVAKEDREQIGQRGKEFSRAREERQKLEAVATDASADAPLKTVKPVKVKRPRTPIASQTVEGLDKADAPPTAVEAPQLDVKIQPKPRKPRATADSPRESSSPREPNSTTRPPRSDRPKAAPKPERTELDPKPERPRVEPAPKPERKPEPAKVEPKPEAPKIEPKEEPKTEQPSAPKGGSDDRPKGGSKKGKGKDKPRN